MLHMNKKNHENHQTPLFRGTLLFQSGVCCFEGLGIFHTTGEVELWHSTTDYQKPTRSMLAEKTVKYNISNGLFTVYMFLDIRTSEHSIST